MEYNNLATKEIVEKIIKSLKEKNIEAIYVENSSDALEKIKKFIPVGASVMNGASQTLEKLGFVNYLKEGKHRWNNLHKSIIDESDPVKQAQLRKTSVLSDYYLGSVHALAETGELVIASNTGSQLPHIVFTSTNLIFVVSTKKIVPTLKDAIDRLNNYVIPLEDERMMGIYKVHTNANKIVIFNGENPMMGRKVRIIFVNEDLGF
ncbi:MAG: lactate utilization protein [Minisyncoccia bacterium]